MPKVRPTTQRSGGSRGPKAERLEKQEEGKQTQALRKGLGYMRGEPRKIAAAKQQFSTDGAVIRG
jgi:hypothetical protein